MGNIGGVDNDRNGWGDVDVMLLKGRFGTNIIKGENLAPDVDDESLQ